MRFRRLNLTGAPSLSENFFVTIEKFLLFWNSHNVHIIEGLLATIVVLSLLQAYRLFFGKKSHDDHDSVSGSSIDAAQIEKTLQKILDSQKHAPSHEASAHGAKHAKDDEHSVPLDMSDMDVGAKEAIAAVEAKAAAQITQLQTALEERKKEVITLQEQVAAGASGAAPAGAASGEESAASRAERDALNDKIKDLEARLAEYEIISEDIADLSKYRDENETLKSELEALKSQAASAPAAAAPAAAVQAAPVAAPAPEPVVPVPLAEVAPEEISPVAAAEAAAAAAEMAPPPSEASNDLIDDDLMKEFAAAVEGQKSLTNAADKATTGEAAPTQGDETEKLMGEFENFVAKKS